MIPLRALYSAKLDARCAMHRQARLTRAEAAHRGISAHWKALSESTHKLFEVER